MDKFGDNGDIKLFGKSDDGTGNRARVLAWVDIFDDGAVDFDIVGF